MQKKDLICDDNEHFILIQTETLIITLKCGFDKDATAFFPSFLSCDCAVDLCFFQWAQIGLRYVDSITIETFTKKSEFYSGKKKRCNFCSKFRLCD